MRRAAAALVLALAGCGWGAAPERGPPAADPVVAQLWSIERPGRAAERLRRAPAVAAVTIAGRRVALLRASAGRRGRVVERIRAGYAVPLDVLAVDPRGYARTVPEPDRAALAGLGAGEAVLSRTSARLRGIGRGGVLRLVGGRRLRVTAVVADASVRHAEVVVAGRRGGDRPLLLAVLRPGARVSPAALARVAERDSAARVPGRGPEGPAHPAQLKARFGEPAVGLPYGDDWVRLDPAFVARHIVTRRVPVLGSVTCHRAMVGALSGALEELVRRGLARLVNPADYAGCHAARRIRPGGALSLHAWGLAVDLNARANPLGARSAQDRRLVRIMVRHGFTWGGDWPTTPDPMHFELRAR